MKLEQGKYYTCIKRPNTNFTVGKDYLAITNYQLLDNNDCTIDVSTGWDMTNFFELVDELPKEQVIHPDHYNKSGIECFDVIKAFFGFDAFEGFCIGNVLKYIMRYKHKGNPMQDLQKASFYLNEVIKLHDNNNG